MKDSVGALMYCFGKGSYNSSNPGRDFEDYLQIKKISSVEFREYIFAAIDKDELDWVELSNETGIYHTYPIYDRPCRFDHDELIMAAYDYKYRFNVADDAKLMTDEISVIKELFGNLKISDFTSIHQIFRLEGLITLPFQLKLAFTSIFTPRVFTTSDVKFFLKKKTWDYLFPNHEKLKLNSDLESFIINILSNDSLFDGWVSAVNLRDSISHIFGPIDLYDLDCLMTVDNFPNLEISQHHRNEYALGFYRLRPKTSFR